MIPAKKRLAPEVEDKAARGLYKLCSELWDECTTASFKNVIDRKTASRNVEKPLKGKSGKVKGMLSKGKGQASASDLGAADESELNGHPIIPQPEVEILDMKYKPELPQTVPLQTIPPELHYNPAEPLLDNGVIQVTQGGVAFDKIRSIQPSFPYGNYYDPNALQDFLRMTQQPQPYMDGFSVNPYVPTPPPVAKSGQENIFQMLKEFQAKYLTMPHKRSHYHAIIAYHIYESQLQENYTAANNSRGTAGTNVPLERNIRAGYSNGMMENRLINTNGRLLNMHVHQ